MLSEAYLYESHHSLQIRDTLSFLESTVRKMDWTRQEQDVVMDIGCGPGGSCRSIFLPCFPGVRKVIAIDVLKDMIAFAQLNNSDDRIEYHVADIEDRQTIEKWSQQLSKVVSTFCFHWLRDMERGFSNIYFLLKPGGEAALLFTASASAWDSYELLYRNPKWSRYLQNADARVPLKKHACHYRSLLENIGFNVVICEIQEKSYTYRDDADCRESWYSICGLSSYIPDEMTEEFKDDLFQSLMKYNGRNSDGKPVVYYKTLSLLIQKPGSASTEPRRGGALDPLKDPFFGCNGL